MKVPRKYDSRKLITRSKNIKTRYPEFDNLIGTILDQEVTELSASYKGRFLNRAAGIAALNDMSNPTKYDNCFLLTKRLCFEAY